VSGESIVPGIKLFVGRQLLNEYPMSKKVIQVGRHPDSEIYLEHGNVSRKHAVFRQEGSTWIVEDKGSQNGLFVNGTFTHFHILKEGDRIEIGKYVLFFTEATIATTTTPATAPNPSAPGSAKDPMFRSMNEILDLIGDSDPDDITDPGGKQLPKQQVQSQPTGAEGAMRTVEMTVDQIQRLHERTSKIMDPHVTYFSDSGVKQVVTLKKDITRLGEDPEFDIFIPVGMFQNKEAARIVREGSEYYIEPVGRRSQVRINEATVDRKSLLEDEMFIHIHKTRIQFHAGVGQDPN
jgi:pSer/pThr/pTyr-binding forkhead associated (FHA) protein